jgi:protein involved in polysaccharide export with SLBB domain
MKLFYRLSCLKWCVCGLLLLGLALGGCSSSSKRSQAASKPKPLPSLAGTLPEDSTLGNPVAPRFRVGETVIVDLTGTADLIPQHSEPIKEDGTITLPYIGAVQAAGKTPGKLQNEIHDLYVPQYYVRLTVTVKSEDRVYYVGGEVRQPGRQLYVGETTVTRAVQSAGDFTDFANRSKVWLVRANGKRVKVNCSKALENSSLDLPVYPGDQIQVPRRFF